MSKYLVETFYTCSFKIIHKLDELNEKKLSELENNSGGKLEIIDVKLNNRKTKAINDKNLNDSLSKSATKNSPDISTQKLKIYIIDKYKFLFENSNELFWF